MNKTNLKIAAIVLAITGVLLFFRSDYPLVIDIFFIEIVLISLVSSNCELGGKLSRLKSIAWNKSLLLNSYIVLLLIHLILTFVLSVNYVNTPEIYREFSSNLILFGTEYVLFMAISLVFVVLFIRKNPPLQILFLPLSVFIIAFISGIITEIAKYLGIADLLFNNYFYAIFSLLPLFWAVYLKHIFLKIPTK